MKFTIDSDEIAKAFFMGIRAILTDCPAGDCQEYEAQKKAFLEKERWKAYPIEDVPDTFLIMFKDEHETTVWEICQILDGLDLVANYDEALVFVDTEIIPLCLREDFAEFMKTMGIEIATGTPQPHYLCTDSELGSGLGSAIAKNLSDLFC